MFQGVIYCAVSPSNKKYYGYSSNFEGRKISHKKAFKQGKKNRFYDSMKKYGFDNFSWNIIEIHNADTKQELHDILCEREKYWILKEQTYLREYGYNLTSGGDGCLGYKYTNEQKQNLSKRLSGSGNPMYGRKQTPESIAKNRQSNLGRKLNDETKEKMKISHEGLTHTKETKEKMKNSWKQRKILFPMSKETKEKISLSKKGENNPNWNKHRSIKTKEKIRLGNLGKKQKRVKCIYCGKECSPSTVKRWHNENCKFKV